MQIEQIKKICANLKDLKLIGGDLINGYGFDMFDHKVIEQSFDESEKAAKAALYDDAMARLDDAGITIIEAVKLLRKYFKLTEDHAGMIIPKT